jgi:phenylacetic acid degradation protein
MPAYSFENFIPVVHPTAFVHPTAVLIGDVIVGAGVYVGPGASLRGDFGTIALEEGSNIQDNCVMHSFPGAGARVGVNGHIGHGAILHGCTVGRGALVGMDAVVMDRAVVGEEAFVAAASFVKAGFEIPPRMLAAGIPAKVLRPLTEPELAWKAEGTVEYQNLARQCLATLRECAPLPAPEPGRPHRTGGYAPLADLKRGP